MTGVNSWGWVGGEEKGGKRKSMCVKESGERGGTGACSARTASLAVLALIRLNKNVQLKQKSPVQESSPDRRQQCRITAATHRTHAARGHMQGRVVNYTGSETRSDTRRHVDGPVFGSPSELSAEESRQRHLEDSKQAKHTLGRSCCM